MTEQARTVLERFQVRKTAKQKAAFRDWLCRELEGAGYEPRVETARSLVRSDNVAAGDPDRAELLLTAHYDTCAVLPFPNFITPRNLLFYVFYNVLIAAGMLAAAMACEAALLLLWPSAPVLLAICFPAIVCFLFLFWMLGGGRANRHTANDNTSGVVTLLEAALALPAADRDKVCFVFFDNEEKGLFGSAAFAAAHKKARRETLTLNFDCVGDGGSIQFYPSRALKKEPAVLERLERAFPSRGGRTVEVFRGFAVYPSDQKQFARGVGVCALRRHPVLGWYMGRIHTGRDTVLEEENIALLREGILSLISGYEKENRTNA